MSAKQKVQSVCWQAQQAQENSQLETYVRPPSPRNYSNSDTVQTDGNETITSTTSVLLSSRVTGAEEWKLL